MADALWFTTARLTIQLSQKDNSGGISLIEHHMAQGFGVPLHAHRDEDENFYVLEGEVRMQTGDQVHNLKAGDALSVAGGTPHSFHVVSKEARFLTITTGQFEDMVRSLGRPASAAGLPPQDQPTEAQIEALVSACAKHGIEFLGPVVA
ncbi:MAG: cupin domain-containing protein [Methylobacterium mesophilicum]|nr:cupin domain-containing protein [Methylobacterium mesophilicum]